MQIRCVQLRSSIGCARHHPHFPEGFPLRVARRLFSIGPAFLLVVSFFCMSRAIHAQSNSSLADRIQKVISRPEFAHANFGIEFYSLDSGKVVYALNADKLFVPASTTKTLTEGTLLAKLGADFRFHTRVYRTGPLSNKGTLKGDLILVASGDPNLSNRIQPDATLAFVDEDHSYGGAAVAGDPIVVNDNVIDLIATPGAKAGDPVSLEVSPKTIYASFVNHLTTSAAGTSPNIQDPDTVTNAGGTLTVTLSGTLPVGGHPITAPYAVPSPALFAETVFAESLAAAGIQIKSPKNVAAPDFKSLAPQYNDANLVAEHISFPLAEEIKVTLKVSQNLHAAMGPYLLGTLVAKDLLDPVHSGFKIERAFLLEAKLDLGGASQGDGEGGDWADLFTPDFIVHYLAYWNTRPDCPAFFKALPILGKDGTLAKIQTDSPGAGHVFAKTGTYGSEDKLSGKMMLNGKGLVGYVITASGQKLAFAAYVNHVSLPSNPDAAQEVAGQALGEIAAAAYDAPLDIP